MLSRNPYMPPAADLGTGLDPASAGTGTFTIGRCMADGWSNTWAHFPLWLGALLLGGLTAIAAALTVIGFFLLVPVLVWGMIRFFLHMHDGQPRIGDLFAGFSRYGQVLGAMLVFLAVTLAVGVPGQGLSAYASSRQDLTLNLIALGLIVVTSVLVSPRLTFASFLIVDRGLGGWQAVQESWRLTRRVQWKLLGMFALLTLAFMFGVVAFLMVGRLVGVYALMIAALPAIMIVYMMLVSAYRQVVGGPLPA